MMLNIETLPVWTATIFAQMSVLILLGILYSMCFRWNAASRHTVLLSTLVAALLLPAVSLFFRANELSIWPTVHAWLSPPSVMKSTPEFVPQRIEFEAEFIEPEFLPAETAIAAPTSVSPITIVAATWGVVSFLLAIRFCVALIGLRRIRRRAIVCVDPNIQAILRRVRNQMGVRRDTELFLSNHVRAPVALGVFRSAILLPKHLITQLTQQELRNVLIHEMAHVKRRDHIVLLLQKFVATFFWPQPLFHLLNRLLSRSREETCDNHVLQFSEKVSYGETLLKLTEHVNPTFSLGLLGNAWKLEDRISQLLNERRNPMTRSNLFAQSAALVICGFATVVISLATPLDAQDTTTATIGELTIANGSQVIELKSPNGKPVVTESRKNLVFVGTDNSGFDDSDLSPGDKQVAEKLKARYQSLKDQQNNLAAKLKKLESKLAKLGVKTGKRTAAIYGVSEPVTVGANGMALTISKPAVVPSVTLSAPADNVAKPPQPVLATVDANIQVDSKSAIPSITARAVPAQAAKPSKPIAATVEGLNIRVDTKPALPMISVTPPSAVRSQKSSDDLEKRLQRLERLIEKVIESNEETRSSASASDQ